MKFLKFKPPSLPKFTAPKFGGKSDAEIFGDENSGTILESQWDETCWGIFRKFNNREVTKREGRIKPLHADFVHQYIPAPGKMAFLLLNGNCQGIDVVMALTTALSKTHGKPTEIILSSLSLNQDTFDKLDTLPIKKQILISSYFLATNPNNIVGRLHRDGRLENYQIGLWRNHTKQGCIAGPGYRIFLHGSANLRSAGDINTMAIHHDPALYDFNRRWMLHLINREPIGKYLSTGKTNTNGFFTFLDQDKVQLFDNGE